VDHPLQLQEKLLHVDRRGCRKHDITRRHSAVEQGLDLLIGGSNLYLGPVLARPECSDLLARDARTGEKVATVTCRNYLAPSFLLTWPGSDLCAEYPASARLDNGQRVVGRIDLLIRTADGLVVMDHKLAGKNEGSVKEIVATWAPQLALYATAIALVSGKPPVGTWLNLPLDGSAVRVMGAG